MSQAGNAVKTVQPRTLDVIDFPPVTFAPFALLTSLSPLHLA